MIDKSTLDPAAGSQAVRAWLRPYSDFWLLTPVFSLQL